MTAKPRIAIIIPALNEERALSLVLQAIPRPDARVIVVDNGSTDRTPFVARDHGAIVTYERRRGYGAACLCGLNMARNADIIVFLDADYSDDPADMERLLFPIENDQADLVIGSRTLGQTQQGALTAPQRFGNALASLFIRRLWQQPCTDLGPFRAVRADALTSLQMDDLGFGWTVQMQARAMRIGMRVTEVPVSYRRRIGRSKISGTLRGVIGAGTKILSTIAREAAQPSPATSANAARQMPHLSIIIPTLNEAGTLAGTLTSIGTSSYIETIVADGGSTDETLTIAHQFETKVVAATRGRGAQMNAGAQTARGQFLLFLHADTRLPFGYLEQIERVLAPRGTAAGAFRLAFDDSRFSLRAIERTANWRSMLCQLPYGDQGLFLSRQCFDAANGFPELPIMEDYAFVRRLLRHGRIRLANTPVITSARRWLTNGIWRTTLKHQAILLGWRLGLSPFRLARWRRQAE